MQPITLRPACASDADFAFRVEEDAMRQYAEETWGHWTPAHGKEAYLRAFVAAEHQVIQLAEHDVGFLTTEVRSDHVFLAQLYLLSLYRNRGIGAQVLSGVVTMAKSLALPVRLRTLAVNVRAQAFYARHGFAVESQHKDRVYFARSDA